MKVRSAAYYSCSVFSHSAAEHLRSIPVIVLNSIEGARTDTSAAALALGRIYPSFIALVTDRIRTAFLGASSASSAHFGNNMRMAALVLLHLARAASASHADVLDRTAEEK